MRALHAAALGALAVAGASAAIAMAGGGPPTAASPPPDPHTVVAHGGATATVVRPRVHRDDTIERAVQAAKRAAIPGAVAAARKDAELLARGARLSLGEVVAITRDVAPVGYWEPDAGRFGPARWCGRMVRRRTVRSGDGPVRHVTRSRHGCEIPREQAVRVTVSFAAR